MAMATVAYRQGIILEGFGRRFVCAAQKGGPSVKHGGMGIKSLEVKAFLDGAPFSPLIRTGGGRQSDEKGNIKQIIPSGRMN